MATFDDAYVRALSAALHDEVREMVAHRVHQPPTREDEVGDLRDDDVRRKVVIVEPLQQERLPQAQVPTVSVTVRAGLVRVEALGSVLEHELTETVWHYEPDGRCPEEHAGWLAEMWREPG